MKSVLWTSLFWILVVVGLGVYTKWFNTQWAQAVSEFVYEQDVGSGEIALDDESVVGQLMLLNTKLDAILSGSMAQSNVQVQTTTSTTTPASDATPPTQDELIIRDLESRIKELEAKQSAAQ